MMYGILYQQSTHCMLQCLMYSIRYNIGCCCNISYLSFPWLTKPEKKGTIYLYFENKRELFLAMLRQIAHAQLASIRAALAERGSLHERLARLFVAFVHLASEESDTFNVYMSALYGVNRAFKTEATKLLRDYVAVIALVLEESQIRGELRSSIDLEAMALMILSLTESYVLSAGVLGLSEAEITRQANNVADLILHGIAKR